MHCIFVDLCYDIIDLFETPIVKEFHKHIVLYKRYINNILLIWLQCRAMSPH